MRNKRKLLLEQLNQELKPFRKAEMILVKSIEEREAKGSISINLLKEVGKELDMQFVYGFVPKDGTIDNLINLKAEKLARKIVLRTNQNMKLENQGIEDRKIKKSIKDLSNEIKREMRKSLWD